MTDELILAIDNGTQSVRALLFDLNGSLVEKVRIPLPAYITDDSGMAEQDPQVFWDAVCQACRQLWQKPGVDKKRIVGVALTTQRSTVINLGADGQPLRRAITWMDNRRTFGLKPVSGYWGLLFALSGMTETVAYLQAEAECNYIRTHEPETWAKTQQICPSFRVSHPQTGRAHRRFDRLPGSLYPLRLQDEEVVRQA